MSKELLKKRNVIGFGRGKKFKDGKQTDTPSLTIFVEKKEDISSLSVDDLIPKTIDGEVTDVIEIGRVYAQQDRKTKHRPAPGGVSIAHYLVTAGTLGTIVKDNKTGKKLILSNNHVLANCNASKLGDLVLQAGSADGGKNPGDLIGVLYNYIPLIFIGETTAPVDPGLPPPTPAPPKEKSWCPIVNAVQKALNFSAKVVGSSWRFEAVKQTVSEPTVTSQVDTDNHIDCAVAIPYSEDLVLEDILEVGKVNGINTNPTIGLPVKKSGRTTGFTQGEIKVTNATVTVYYGNKSALFVNQLMAGYMSDGGDSGSLVLDKENQAVGLLFAGSAAATFFNPISTVLNALDVSF